MSLFLYVFRYVVRSLCIVFFISSCSVLVNSFCYVCCSVFIYVVLSLWLYFVSVSFVRSFVLYVCLTLCVMVFVRSSLVLSFFL